jgi:hypothetical protein
VRKQTSRRGDGRKLSPLLPVFDFLQALAKVGPINGAKERTAFRQFAMARDEDWLLPTAYAACRATGGVSPIDSYFSDYDPAPAESLISRVFRSRSKQGGDWLELLRRADEASDLAYVADLVLQSSQDQKSASDLRLMLRLLSGWQERVRISLRSELEV